MPPRCPSGLTIASPLAWSCMAEPDPSWNPTAPAAAPGAAVLVAQTAAETDLDAPLLLREDRDNPLRYDAHGVHPSTPELWG